jgi:hypothetical protein
MGLGDKLKQSSDYLRKLRVSRGPDSYFQYEREREHERKQADRAREDAQDSADLKRDNADRERRYEARYTREREGEVARGRTERAEEPESEPDH